MSILTRPSQQIIILKALVIVLIIILVNSSLTKLSAQTYMVVNLSNDSILYIDIEDIEKLTFENMVTNDPELLQKIAKVFNNLKSYPNPASKELTLEYELLHTTRINLQLVNLEGSIVFTKDLGVQKEGANTITLDIQSFLSADIKSGLYVCYLYGSNQRIVNKVILIN